jgi:hypothetical protein
VLSEANTYTDNAISNLINNAPEAFDTLNELATALGNSEDITTNIVTMISKNTEQIEQEAANRETKDEELLKALDEEITNGLAAEAS